MYHLCPPCCDIIVTDKKFSFKTEFCNLKCGFYSFPNGTIFLAFKGWLFLTNLAPFKERGSRIINNIVQKFFRTLQQQSKIGESRSRRVLRRLIPFEIESTWLSLLAFYGLFQMWHSQWTISPHLLPPVSALQIVFSPASSSTPFSIKPLLFNKVHDKDLLDAIKSAVIWRQFADIERNNNVLQSIIIGPSFSRPGLLS